MSTDTICSSSEGTVSYAGGADGLAVMTDKLVPLLGEPGLSLNDLTMELRKEVRLARGTSSGGRMLVESQAKREEPFYFAAAGTGAAPRRTTSRTVGRVGGAKKGGLENSRLHPAFLVAVMVMLAAVYFRFLAP